MTPEKTCRQEQKSADKTEHLLRVEIYVCGGRIFIFVTRRR